MHQPNSLSFFSHRGEEQGQQRGNPLLGSKLCVQNWGGGAAGGVEELPGDCRKFHYLLGVLSIVCITFFFFNPNVFDSI